MGDFSIIESTDYLNPDENYIFWVIWTFTSVFTCVIFLNFIVAEASAGYETIIKEINYYIQIERARQIAEAEGLIPNLFKKFSPKNYPKYIIIRKLES